MGRETMTASRIGMTISRLNSIVYPGRLAVKAAIVIRPSYFASYIMRLASGAR